MFSDDGVGRKPAKLSGIDPRMAFLKRLALLVSLELRKGSPKCRRLALEIKRILERKRASIIRRKLG